LRKDVWIKPYFSFFFLLGHLLSMAATAGNPLLYAWMNQSFREEIFFTVPLLAKLCSQELSQLEGSYSARSRRGRHYSPSVRGIGISNKKAREWERATSQSTNELMSRDRTTVFSELSAKKRERCYTVGSNVRPSVIRSSQMETTFTNTINTESTTEAAKVDMDSD